MNDAPPEVDHKEVDPSRLGRLRANPRARLVAAALVLLLVAAALLVWRYFSVRESTDDAQIDGHLNPVAARVSGTVASVLVADNQFVEKGTLLVSIDPADLKVALAHAEADLAENEASARAAGRTVPLTST